MHTKSVELLKKKISESRKNYEEEIELLEGYNFPPEAEMLLKMVLTTHRNSLLFMEMLSAAILFPEEDISDLLEGWK